MAEHKFLHGKKHLPAQAFRIARLHEAELVNHTDPQTLERSHWFTRAGHNPASEAALRDALLAAGVRVDRTHR